MVLVRLLGPVDVVDGSGAVRPIGSALRRTLLALLALHTGKVLSADWLLEHAWQGEPPDSGLRALRFHISRLRKELGEANVIETRPGGYRLVISATEVDVLAIEGVARHAWHESNPSLAADAYSAALAMWRGEPFADAAPCSTLDDESIRLGELRLVITENYFQARLAAGAGREVVADLSRATAQHPLRETLWAILIAAQYRAGMQADALRSYEQMRTLLADTLGLDPSRELQDLQRRVLQHDPSLIVDSEQRASESTVTRHNLPTVETTLIDRGDRVGRAATLLRDHRLLTLTGPGGVGKTRLALELGWSFVDRFEGGVWLVELAPLTTAESVVAAVASTLAVRTQSDSGVVDALVDWFHGRSVLLIVDNCEHLLDPVRRLLAVVLARCPTVKVIVTSQAPLGLAGERVHPVTMLDPEADGVALFLDRAASADTSFVASEAEHGAVVDICRRLDGLPLAIELAAARVRSFAPVDLLARLDDRFRLLHAAHTGSDRHDTLRDTVEWSYHLLTESERELFCRLAAFGGDFDLRATEAVCVGDMVEAGEVVDLLSNLVDKSMVVAERHTDGTRYRLLETLRQFATVQSENAGHMSDVRDRHLDHFVAVAERADDLFRSSRQVDGAAVFDREWDNLRAAHDWAIATENLDAAERMLLAAYMYATSYMRFEHGDWAEATIALVTAEHQAGTQAYALAAHWEFRHEHMTRAFELLNISIDRAISMDDPTAALCLSMGREHEHLRLGDDQVQKFEVVASKVDLDREWWMLIELVEMGNKVYSAEVPARLARLAEVAERVRAPILMAASAKFLGHRALDEDPPDLVTALMHYRRSLDLACQGGDVVSIGDGLRAIAMCEVGLHTTAAPAACRDALVSLYEMRYWFRVWQLSRSIEFVLASSGEVESAALVAGYLLAHHEPYGFECDLGFPDRTHEIIRQHREVDQWMARGAGMDRHQIVDHMLRSM